MVAILQQDDRFTVSGKLIRNKVIESALNLDERLIQLLIDHPSTKSSFFAVVGESLVFDSRKFQRFISNKRFLPDSYTAFQNRIGLQVGDRFISDSSDVVLAWPHKDCLLEGGQRNESDRRNERFFNETLASDEIDILLEPKVFKSFERFTKNGAKKADHISLSDNLLIKGNNLLALYSLRTRLTDKVKLIYIDPPYNTGGDANIFTYNNSFNHSTWLTFMKNRLSIARELLRKDGFFVVAIDHSELLYLGVMADEIFGRENRIGILTVVNNPMGRNQAKFFSTVNDFMLVYAKDKAVAKFNSVILHEEERAGFSEKDYIGYFDSRSYIRTGGGSAALRESKPNFWYPIYVDATNFGIRLDRLNKSDIEVWPVMESGQERTWKKIRSSTQKMIDSGDLFARIEADKNQNKSCQIYEKYRIEQGKKVSTVWSQSKYNANHHGKRLLNDLVPNIDFSYPKSRYTLIDVLKIMTSDGDVILDFFAGSGTTGDAAITLNQEEGGRRRFVLVEQLDSHFKYCQQRICSVLRGSDSDDSFVSARLATKNQKFIDQVQKSKESGELSTLFQKARSENTIDYRIDPKMFQDLLPRFEELSFEDQKRALIDLLDKNQLYVNYSEIDDVENQISNHEKSMNRCFYGDHE